MKGPSTLDVADTQGGARGGPTVGTSVSELASRRSPWRLPDPEPRPVTGRQPECRGCTLSLPIAQGSP